MRSPLKRPPFVFGEPALHSRQCVSPVFAETGLAEDFVEKPAENVPDTRHPGYDELKEDSP